MRLEGEVDFYRPGQFVNIAVPGFTLRRPISVCDWDDRSFTIVYAVVGDGTERMSRAKALTYSFRLGLDLIRMPAQSALCSSEEAWDVPLSTDWPDACLSAVCARLWCLDSIPQRR